MQITVTKGHLTTTEKRAIVAILKADLMEGKVGRKNYFISRENDLYNVNIVENKRGLGFIGEPIRQCTDKHQFTLK